MVYICDSFDFIPKVLGNDRELTTLTIKPIALKIVRDIVRSSEVDCYIHNQAIAGYFSELLGCRVYAGNDVQPLTIFDELIIGIYHSDHVRWWRVFIDE